MEAAQPIGRFLGCQQAMGSMKTHAWTNPRYAWIAAHKPKNDPPIMFDARESEYMNDNNQPTLDVTIMQYDMSSFLEQWVESEDNTSEKNWIIRSNNLADVAAKHMNRFRSANICDLRSVLKSRYDLIVSDCFRSADFHLSVVKRRLKLLECSKRLKVGILSTKATEQVASHVTEEPMQYVVPVQLAQLHLAQKFLYGPTMYLRLIHWAQNLRWSHNEGRTSLLELMLDFMYTEGVQFPIIRKARTFRNEESYVYHEDDPQGFTDLFSKSLKQNLDMFYDCIQMFSTVSRFNLLPDYNDRKLMTFAFSGVSLVLSGIKRKVTLTSADKVYATLNGFVPVDGSRVYQTSSFLRRSVFVDTSCHVSDRPNYVRASSNATDMTNALRYFCKKVRKGIESQAEIQEPQCVLGSRTTGSVVQHDAV